MDPVKTKAKFLAIRKAAPAKSGIVTHICLGDSKKAIVYIPGTIMCLFTGGGFVIGTPGMILIPFISVFCRELTRPQVFITMISPLLACAAIGFTLGLLCDIGVVLFGTLSFAKERYDNFRFSKLDLLKEMESVNLSSEQEVDVLYLTSKSVQVGQEDASYSKRMVAIPTAPKMDTLQNEGPQSNVQNASATSNVSNIATSD